jgi:hypothetical protein
VVSYRFFEDSVPACQCDETCVFAARQEIPDVIDSHINRCATSYQDNFLEVLRQHTDSMCPLLVGSFSRTTRRAAIAKDRGRRKTGYKESLFQPVEPFHFGAYHSRLCRTVQPAQSFPFS